jgi:hypothetical protein
MRRIRGDITPFSDLKPPVGDGHVADDPERYGL